MIEACSRRAGSPAGLIGDNDLRFALFGDFGDFDVMGAVVGPLDPPEAHGA